MKIEKKDALDTMIENALGGIPPELNFDDWTHKYQTQVRIFEAEIQAVHANPATRKTRWMTVAAAAVILIAMSLFVVTTMHSPPESVHISQINLSSVSEMSLLALNVAYERGGLEAVDKQYKKAYVKLGSRSNSISIHELFNEM
ncbi:MAG: hypothetical protein JXA82_07275 [Sedimentisphaerales bacterium]|nr:hypothetical protein [Sedimentisphaerales bacterium]